MLKQMIEKPASEKGNALIMFAMVFVVLLGFVSMALDIGIAGMKRAQMMDLCQQMRKARLDAKDYVMSAADPARMIYDISNQCAVENGFTGSVKIYYQEQNDPVTPTSNWVWSRTYRVRVELQQEYRFSSAAMLFAGSETMTISVYLDGGERKNSDAARSVWYPYGTLKNGSYVRQDSMGILAPVFNPGDCPTW